MTCELAKPLRTPQSLDKRDWVGIGTWLIPAARKAGSFHSAAISPC